MKRERDLWCDLGFDLLAWCLGVRSTLYSLSVLAYDPAHDLACQGAGTPYLSLDQPALCRPVRDLYWYTQAINEGLKKPMQIGHIEGDYCMKLESLLSISHIPPSWPKESD